MNKQVLRVIDKIIVVIATISFVILVGCLSVLPIAKSKSYYISQFKKNNVENILETYSFNGSTRIEKNATTSEDDVRKYPKYDVTMNDLNIVCDKIINYLYHQDVESMQYVIDTEDGPFEFFSSQAIVHMADVKVLFIGGIKLCYIFIAIFIVCLAYLIFRRNYIKYDISKLYITTVVLFLVVTCGLAIYAIVDFDSAFIFFHKLIFPDSSKVELAITFTSWDTLTNVLTGEFFMNTGVIIGITFGAIMILSIACVILVDKFVIRKKAPM